ncbi:MAG: YceD family protein [Archangium sp.]
MLVKIEQIRDEGLQVNEQMSLELLGAALEGSGFRATEPLAVQANLRKVSGGVLVGGKFTARVVADCKRCLVEAKLELPVSFTINFVPESLARGEDVLDEEALEEKDRGQSENGGSFALDDADEEVFNGKVIDLEPIVREQVLLALPMNAVCREDCRGLCMKCGQNLNEKQCGCETKFEDPRLAVLKNFKLQG